VEGIDNHPSSTDDIEDQEEDDENFVTKSDARCETCNLKELEENPLYHISNSRNSLIDGNDDEEGVSPMFSSNMLNLSIDTIGHMIKSQNKDKGFFEYNLKNIKIDGR